MVASFRNDKSRDVGVLRANKYRDQQVVKTKMRFLAETGVVLFPHQPEPNLLGRPQQPEANLLQRLA